MKQSAEIAGLPIISILDGIQIGSVKNLVLNPEKGTIEFLTIEHEEWEENVKAIPFKKVVGIGEYALTIENGNAIIDLLELPVVNELVTKGIRISGTRVMTRKGQLLGEAVEFFTDDENGQVIGMVLSINGEERFLAAEFVQTYGRDIIIVQEEAEKNLEPLKGSETLVIREEGGAIPSIWQKQIELLSGKKVMKDILSGTGEVLIEEGTFLSAEDVEKAQEEGPGVIVELSMRRLMQSGE
ncbi:PRC-barrel domain-containing protein [Peribacillus sp. SCS-37]|uniref:PRC-barrel domain-containing protein n=1 Tax=Paraperibacillus esterisolvens TaxID=3115296 RepID=UPI003906979C